MEKNWHSMPADEVLKHLGSARPGLSQAEADKRLAQFGPNELVEAKRTSPLEMFLAQFKNFLIIVLIGAAAVSFGIGLYNGGDEELIDGIVITAILIVNAILGFVQEYRAEKAMLALKSMVAPMANVVRDGVVARIDARKIVPGDIIVVEAGDRIPASARLLEVVNLKVDEASLTGESVPVTKGLQVLDEKTQLSDRKNMVFMATSVTYGRGTAVVTSTGMNTEFGRIASMIQATEKEHTPLQKRLEQVGKHLGAGVLAICAIVFIAGSLYGTETVSEMFLTSVALAVAAIPEGLPAVVTITLALGLKRLVKQHAIIRKLPAVETLGSTTVICSDKTGTLTRNEMTVRRIYTSGEVLEVTGDGYSTEGDVLSGGKLVHGREDVQLMARISSLCNNASISGGIVGDPTEVGLVVFAQKAGVTHDDANRQFPRVSEIPFDSERKHMTTIHKEDMKTGRHEDRLVAYTKGAADVIIRLCGRIYDGGKVRRITGADIKKITAANDEFANDALRVLATAYRPLSGGENEIEKDLVFVGLIGMIDPPRQDAIDAVALCKKAGIKTIMITGDHMLTAVAVGRHMGIYDVGLVMTGAELDEIEDCELDRIVNDVVIYARVNPEHKLRIVNSLKRGGHVVAMTGDGVNDAPALKSADIGVAMGITGTDVSKEAADMILTDDNFASIVSAVEEGRGIYDNLRKFVRYLLSCNAGEIMTIFVAMVAMPKIPLPLAPVQILWMNLVTDGMSALALGVDPNEKDVMQKKPRDKNAAVIDCRLFIDMMMVGAIMCAGTLLIYNASQCGGEDYARTMAFTTIIMFQMFYVFSCRSERHTLSSQGVFTNKWLILAVASSIALQVCVLYIPMLQTAFGTVALGAGDWARVLVVSSTIFIFGEVRKLAGFR